MSTAGQQLVPRSHWSKDFVEHLRTVHFTLVIVCVALIALITSDRRSVVSDARQELHGIRSVIEKWNSNWLEDDAQHAFANTMLPVTQLVSDPGKNQIDVEAPDGRHFVFDIEYDGPNWMVNTVDDSLTSPVNARWPMSLHDPPLNLKYFHEFWDNLARGIAYKIPLILDDTPLAFDTSRPLKAQFVSGKKPDSPTPVHLKLTMRTVRTDITGDFSRGLYASDSGLASPFTIPHSLYSFLTIAVPIKRSQSFYFDPYQKFVPPGAQWRREPFSDAFPNLSVMTKNYEELGFDTLDKILEAEESRTGDSFEAVGIKFPAGGVTGWGIIMVVGIQLYFFVHLHELKERLGSEDEGWGVAWIGVYKSRLAIAVYFVSCALLPATAAFILTYHLPFLTHDDKVSRTVVSVLVAGISMALGLRSWMRLATKKGSNLEPDAGVVTDVDKANR
jgi:hypothetical protein